MRSLDKKGIAELNAGLYQKAITTYEYLLGIAKSNRDIYNAMKGLAQAYLSANDFDNAIVYADKIEKAGWKPVGSENLTNMIFARSYFNKKEYQKAGDYLIRIINEGQGQAAAEALYLFAQIQYNDSKYRGSIESLLRLITDFAAYHQWTDKVYILLIDNYIKLDELLQAKATANSILEKSDNQELINRAKEKLREIEQLEYKEVNIKADTTQ